MVQRQSKETEESKGATLFFLNTWGQGLAIPSPITKNEYDMRRMVKHRRIFHPEPPTHP